MARKMKRYNGEEGSAVEVDALEEANKSTEGMLSNPNAKEYGESGTSYTTKATPKAAPKAAAKPKAESKAAPKAESKAAPVDVTKLSVAERRKLSRENPSVSGPTDTRSVSQRLRAAFGMKNGGSASSRADGIASRGKTNCKMY
jgi:hypothetical protein